MGTRYIDFIKIIMKQDITELRGLASKLKHSAVVRQHLDQNIPITESFLRMGSDSWCELVNFYRDNIDERNYSSGDRPILQKLQTGKPAYYRHEGVWKKVKLDLPEVKEHKGKKFVVYRKTERTHEGLPVAKAIRFGSAEASLYIKNDDEARRKSFWARHKCSLKTDKNSAGWWACYAPELFGDILKLKGGKSRW